MSNENPRLKAEQLTPHANNVIRNLLFCNQFEWVGCWPTRQREQCES